MGGAQAAAEKGLADAKIAAEGARKRCLCDVKSTQNEEYAAEKQKADSAANAKLWRKSHLLICALEHKDAKQCTIPDAPTIAKADLNIIPAAKNAVDCGRAFYFAKEGMSCDEACVENHDMLCDDAPMKAFGSAAYHGNLKPLNAAIKQTQAPNVIVTSVVKKNNLHAYTAEMRRIDMQHVYPAIAFGPKGLKAPPGSHVELYVRNPSTMYPTCRAIEPCKYGCKEGGNRHFFARLCACKKA